MPYSQRMDSEKPAGDYSGLPGEHITIDQLVAANIRYWRRKAKLTQDELGERVGWSGANISAAELSAAADKDKRRFDAHTLVTFARALDIPVSALLLPPEDDGITKRYLFHAAPDECSPMSELVSLLISDPFGEDTEVADAYRQRYNAAVLGYLDAERGAELAAASGDLTSAESRAERLERIRWQREALAALVGDLDAIADAITDTGETS